MTREQVQETIAERAQVRPPPDAPFVVCRHCVSYGCYTTTPLRRAGSQHGGPRKASGQESGPQKEGARSLTHTLLRCVCGTY